MQAKETLVDNEEKEMIWKRIKPGEYHADNQRFMIKREPGTKDTWVLYDKNYPEKTFIHYLLKGCKDKAEEIEGNYHD